MKQLLICLSLLFSTLTFASNETIAVTVKPSTGLAGTTSYNLHASGVLTKLVYVSRTEIQEHTINTSSESKAQFKALAKSLIAEVISTEDYSTWQNEQGSLAIAVTLDEVTKSISTKRFSPKALELKLLLGDLK